MNIDLLTKHSLELNYNSIENPKISLVIDNGITKQDFQKDLYLLLEKYKNEIDTISNNKVWDFSKKLTNNFEMIHIHSKINSSHNLSIANYEPISRSYFKLWEMIKDFNLIDFKKKNLEIIGLAEGPGGFMECIYNMRKKYSNNYTDKCTCMTLRSYKNKIPGWKKSGRLFKENSSINIFYGIDNSGNLYKKNNIIFLKNKFLKNKADIVTADGGFDFSIDYNKQEQMAYQLLFCEIISAFCTLKKNGVFVIKIFDIFTDFTVKLLYFLTIFFEKVIITKPFTSRPANSEKYVICKNFKGIDDDYLNKLLSIVDDWDFLSAQNKYINNIFDIAVPENFKKSIMKYNLYIVSLQIQNILKTLSYINLQLDNKIINKIKQKQALTGSLWCKKYDILVNLRCKFLKENTEHYNYIPDYINY